MNTNIFIGIVIFIVWALFMIKFVKYNKMQKYLSDGDQVKYFDTDEKKYKIGVVDSINDDLVLLRGETADDLLICIPIEELEPVFFYKYKKK